MLVSSVTLMSRWKADLPSSASDLPPMNQLSAAMYCTVTAMTGSALPSTLCVSSATVSTVLRVRAASGWPERWTTMWGMVDSFCVEERVVDGVIVGFL
ncbi:hypothetical protein D3C86_935230 [compost metagenome]